MSSAVERFVYRLLWGRETVRYQGIRIRRDPAIISDPIWRKIARHRYERHELAAARALVRSGDRILELGAGLGLVSAILGKQHPDASIVALEANPRLIPFIEGLHAANGIRNVRVENMLVSHDPEPAKPFYLRRNFWSSSLDPATGSFEEQVSVRNAAFGTVLHEIRPNVIICDIEGGEFALFAAELDLSPVRGIVMEIHQRRASPDATRVLVDQLSAQGLAYRARHSRGEVFAFER
jgi:FkbM family methyltransferase